jgi:succinate dehydrogenase / fumarate reductase, iron-sulfur subunit
MMRVRVKIRRFNPEKDRKPYWATYTLDAEPLDRVLDLLVQIKSYQDGTLTFRRSCAHGVCGSDAMLINGHNRLACKVLVKDEGRSITVEALRGLPIIKDLVVDMEPFFAQYAPIMPWLINDEPPPYTERLQSPQARCATMTRRNASCVPPAPRPARSFGLTPAMWGPQPSSRRTALSSTTATRARRCA